MISGIVIYFALLMGLAIYSQRQSSGGALDYFLGGRRLGVLPLAMTTAATYVSASSFIGGPGIAYSRGLSWVFLAAVQYPVSLLMLGLLGQRLRQLGHRHNLYDLADYIGLRYGSQCYRRFCAALIALALLLGLMVALLGGSRLLQGALGWSYRQALLAFSLALGIYTLLGGFRAVVLTDILQGTWMLLASVVLFVFMWQQAGGSAGLERFAAASPAMFSPDSGGKQALRYTLNFTILVGFGMVAHPIMFSRLLALKKGRSLRNSILISMAVIGLLTFLPHFIGFLARLVLPGIEAPDQLMGRLSQLFLQYGRAGQIFSGMLVSALLAAIMSTADSALNTLGLTIYRHLLPRRIFRHKTAEPAEQRTSERRHFQLSRLLTGLAIVLTALLALHPPRLLVALNLYTLGGLQVSLLWPVLLGMYTRRPGVGAAGSSSMAGLGSYVLLNRLLPSFGGAALLPYSLLAGLAAWLVAAQFSPPAR